MNDRELARLVAAGEGGDVAAEVERESGRSRASSDQVRALGLTEAMAVASFLTSCARLAVEIWRARQDRALLLLALVETTENDPKIRTLLDPEKRLGLVAKLVNRLVPERFGSSPSIPITSANTKKEWISNWLGFGTRTWTPTVLMPFANMDNFVVYQPITWSRPDAAPSDLPRIVTVPRGFVTDLATIPEYFWWALPPYGKYGHAAILHDWLYWDQVTSRRVADRVFDVAMEEMAVPLPLRKAMWAAVRVYGGGYWNEATAQRDSGQNRVLKKFPDNPTVAWADWQKQPDVFA
jgi:hypothetical protein